LPTLLYPGRARIRKPGSQWKGVAGRKKIWVGKKGKKGEGREGLICKKAGAPEGSDRLELSTGEWGETKLDSSVEKAAGGGGEKDAQGGEKGREEAECNS